MPTDRAGELSGRGGIAAAQAASDERLTIRIKPVPPVRLDPTVRVLRRHPANLIDRFDGLAYHRVLIIQGRPVSVTVIQTTPPERPMLEVTVKGHPVAPIARCWTMSALQRLLGLGALISGAGAGARGSCNAFGASEDGQGHPDLRREGRGAQQRRGAQGVPGGAALIRPSSSSYMPSHRAEHAPNQAVVEGRSSRATSPDGGPSETPSSRPSLR